MFALPNHHCYRIMVQLLPTILVHYPFDIKPRLHIIPKDGFYNSPNMACPASVAVAFYTKRGQIKQSPTRHSFGDGAWIKEGKYALNWTRLPCHRFAANQVRLALFVLAYNLGNFLRRLALPASIQHWSLHSIQTKLIKIGTKVVFHARRIIFQMIEVAVAKQLFSQILHRIWALAPG